MTGMSQAQWELLAIETLIELDWPHVPGDEIAAGNDQRAGWDDLVIAPRLMSALKRPVGRSTEEAGTLTLGLLEMLRRRRDAEADPQRPEPAVLEPGPAGHQPAPGDRGVVVEQMESMAPRYARDREARGS